MGEEADAFCLTEDGKQKGTVLLCDKGGLNEQLHMKWLIQLLIFLFFAKMVKRNS
jgi:hypothetical protein